MDSYNPKKHRVDNTKPSKAITFQLKNVEDPVGLEIRDPEKIQELYKRWPLIPYAGTFEQSNDGLLSFFNSAKYISPTQGACHNSIKMFLFGGKLQINRSQDPDFDLGDEVEEVTPELKAEYASFIKGITTECPTVIKAACDLYDEMASNGNIFVELVHTSTGGQRSSAFYPHPTEHCRYWATLKGEPKMVMVSEVFTEDYFRRYPPRVIPVFPNYATDEDGTQRTIIHVKNGNFRWYGRPLSAGGWIDVFGEAKERTYLTKIAANNFTGQGVMEVEDDDVQTDGMARSNEDAIDNGYQGVADRFDDNFSASSDNPQTWLLMSRPKGARPVFIYEFKMHTNENFYKTVGAMHRAAIIENNAWSERLLGNAVAEGFSHDNFLAELRVKDVSTLKIYRDYVCSTLELIFTQCALFEQRAELATLGISLDSAVKKIAKMKAVDIKEMITSYGTAVRAGAITSTKDDELFMRASLGLPEINEQVDEAWEEDGGYRRPVTLKASEDSVSQTNERDE